MSSNDPFSTPPSGDPITSAPAEEATRRRGRAGIAVGLTAGLIGGAAAGLVFGVPGIGSASVSDAPSTVLAQVDDTEAPSEEDRVAARAERLREFLQPLVDDAVIDAAQADAIAEYMVENAPERPGKGQRGPGSRGAGVINEAVTDLLGLTPAELREQLMDGATLAEVATGQGIDPQDVIDEIVGEAEERLDQAVANGRLDQAEADEKLAETTERIAEVVNNGRSEAAPGGFGRGGPGGFGRGGPGGFGGGPRANGPLDG
ncbi:MAG: hypothetical protein AAGF73_08310 [Actinomycetota bacterium]